MTPHDPGTRVPVLSHKIPKTVRSAPARSSSSSSPSSLPLTAHLLYAMQYLKHVLVCSNTPHEAIIPVSWEINGSGGALRSQQGTSNQRGGLRGAAVAFDVC